MPRTLRIATRKSPLALWQAEHVADRLRAAHPGLRVELVKMVTRGDRILDAPLAKVGGKGLFVKELEQGMLAGLADIAVHSMKDVPADLPEGLHLSAILAREDPRDALVSRRYRHLDELPPAARLGTSSLRRQCQLRRRLPRSEIVPLRGNVGTRLERLETERLDAIILAAAGLIRLGMGQRITQILSPEQSLPAVGQGAIGVECRMDDDAVNQLLAVLRDADTTACVSAERGFNRRLDGGCQVPIAGHATLRDGDIWLRGLVASPDGRSLIEGDIRGPRGEASGLGVALAERLLTQGADRILEQLRDSA